AHDRDAARRRLEEAQQDRDGGRFSGAVRPQKRGDAAARYREVEAGNGLDGAEALGEILDDDDVAGRSGIHERYGRPYSVDGSWLRSMRRFSRRRSRRRLSSAIRFSTKRPWKRWMPTARP